MTMLSVDVEKRLGTVQIAVKFAAADHGVTALFGRSGAGKTSVVNMIAGLLRPDRGRIAVGDRVLFDTDARIDLAPEHRRVGYVFQDGRLFPHLSVRRNLTYGDRNGKTHDDGGGFDDVVALLGLDALLDRRPATLSGGERQRVAIGRALLAHPSLLLMDEPLANLDAPRKAEILPYLERLRDELQLPIVYVSHAIDEVARLADTLVLMSDGAVAGEGPVEDVLGRLDLRPMAGRYEFGSLIDAEVASHDSEYGLSLLTFGDPAAPKQLVVPRLALDPGNAVRIRVRARDVILSLDPPQRISTQNVLAGHIVEIAPAADSEPHVELKLDVGAPLAARVTRRTVDALDLTVGKPVYALIKTVALDSRALGRIGSRREP
jgi:molybdate transport system ATP-binding protein